MGVVQRNSGTHNGSGTFAVSLPAASSAANRVVVIITGNTVVSTPGGWTLRTSQVNFMGHYLWDRAGGAQSYNFSANGQLTWFIEEVEAGTYINALSQNNSGNALSYNTPAITPSAGTRHLIASLGSTASIANQGRTITSWSDGFTERADIVVPTADYPHGAYADLEVTANGSTAYSTTGTYSGNAVGRTAIIAVYGTSSGVVEPSAGTFTGATTRTGTYVGSAPTIPPTTGTFTGVTAYTGSYAGAVNVVRTMTEPAYAVFNADTAQAKQDWSAAGGTHVVIAARWSDLEPTQGTIDATALADLKQQFADAASAGLGVIFSFSTHYTPTWIKAAAPRFKDQDGVEWTSSNSLGDDVVDVVWSQVARDAIANYQDQVWAALTSAERAQVKDIRLGGGPYGEVHYPRPGDPISWWGYSTPAQTGTGLASGMDVCPAPGHVPFDTPGGELSTNASAITTDASAWEPDNAGTSVTRDTSLGQTYLRVARSVNGNKAMARIVTGERVTTSPGETCTAAVTGRNAPGQSRTAILRIVFYDGGGAEVGTVDQVQQLFDYETTITASGVAPAGAVTAGLKFGLDPAAIESSQPFYGRDFRLVTGADPDEQFTEWYLDSLTKYVLWQIDRVRAIGYAGTVHILHPSFGLRDNMVFGSTAYQQQTAEGVDYARQVAAYAPADLEAHPQSTWANGEDPFPGGAVDSDRAAWRKLLEVAVANNRADLLGGENTGGSDPDWDNNTDVDRMFGVDGSFEGTSVDTAGSRYTILTWLNWPRLNGEVAGDHATLEHLSTYMLDEAPSGTFTGSTARTGSYVGASTRSGAFTPGVTAYAGTYTAARPSQGTHQGTTAYTGTYTGARASQGVHQGQTAYTGTYEGTAPVVPDAGGTFTGSTTYAGSYVGEAPIVPDAGGAFTGSTSYTGTYVGAAPIVPDRSGTYTGTTSRTGTYEGTAPPVGEAGGTFGGTTAYTSSYVGTTSRTGTYTGSTTRVGSYVGDAPELDAAAGTFTGTTSRTGSYVGRAIPVGEYTSTTTYTGTYVATTDRAGTFTGETTWTGTYTGGAPRAGTYTGSTSWAGSHVGNTPPVGVLSVTEGRVYVVPAEVREFTVPAEAREYTVPAENRTMEATR